MHPKKRAIGLPITLLGFFYLIKQGLSWRSFGEAARAVEAERGKEAEGAVV